MTADDTPDQQDQPDHPDSGEALRARLRAADPASSLPPADPDGLARLMEDTMSDEHTVESRSDGTHRRSGLTWLVAAAAVVLIAAGVAFALGTRGDDDPTAGPSSDVAQSDPASPRQTVTRLTLGAEPGSARCAVPTPQTVGNQELAFDGTVQSISGGVVTLEASKFYRGEQTDLVTVSAPDQNLQQLLAAVDFEEGGRYLVAATDGQVAVCMISTEWTPDAERLYEQAFGG